MVKAVILDDEYLVIDAMKVLVDWEKYGITIAGTAMDGISGFDLIVKERPQIVLTDIRMPGMDGLSIIEKVKCIYPGIQFILFSGYTDFEYAKKAIVLGVLDYIVKPVTAAKVEEALRKALGNLGLLKSSEETRELVKEELIRAGEAAKENWDAAGMPISIEDIRGCMILVCSVPVQNLRIREFLNHSTGLKKYGVFYSVYPQMQMVMCLAAVNSHKEELQKSLEGVLRIWQQDYEEAYIGFSYAAAVQTKIPEVFAQAKEAMTYGQFLGNTQPVDYQMLRQSKRLPDNIQKCERAILEAVRVNRTEEIDEAVSDFIMECRDKNTGPELVKHFVLETIYSALGLMKEQTGGMGEGIFTDGEETPVHVEVGRCTNYPELRSCFFQKLCDISRTMENVRAGGRKRSEIQEVQNYIHSHYRDDLTLFDLSEKARMTPAYFSSVFRQEVGTTYIKYLTQVRMEKAKQLLNEGYKVFEVSQMVGYENYRYFCVLFKKYTGVTAQQYKGVTKN